VTEPEWLACTDLRRMLDHVQSLATVHKMLAFAAALDRLLPPSSDQEAGPEVTAGDPYDPFEPGPPAQESYNDYLLVALPQEVLRRTYRGLSAEQRQGAGFAACGLLREVFNPFASAPLSRAWLAANDGAVPKLASGIYADQAFDRLPILADALEEAGCSDNRLLVHLRGSGPHVRGCWALDTVLGKD
jgi:hypothetical protein